MDKELYKPFKSNAKNKKYSVYVKENNKPKLIHFGDKRYEHFKDKIGEYKTLDHGDKERRDNYLKRAKGIKDKQGKLTYKDKNSANYWAVNFLW
jgi:hypothetical protein